MTKKQKIGSSKNHKLGEDPKKLNWNNMTSGNRSFLYEKIAEHIVGDSCLDLGAREGKLKQYIDIEYLGLDIRSEDDSVIECNMFDFLNEDERKWGTICAIDVLEHLTSDEVARLLPMLGNCCNRFLANLPCPYTQSFWRNPTHKTPWFPEILGEGALMAGFKSYSYEFHEEYEKDRKFARIRNFIFNNITSKNIFRKNEFFPQTKGFLFYADNRV